jgi:hypothetical protein
MKVAVNPIDPFQPIQDWFAHIESTDIEDNLGQILVFSVRWQIGVNY